MCTFENITIVVGLKEDHRSGSLFFDSINAILAAAQIDFISLRFVSDFVV